MNITINFYRSISFRYRIPKNQIHFLLYNPLYLAFFFSSFHERFHVVYILSDEDRVKYAARLTHTLPDEFALCLFVTVLGPVQEVWKHVDDIEDSDRVRHALVETDILDDILWGSALFEDDFGHLLSNLSVYNIVLNQVEDMKDVLDLHIIYHYILLFIQTIYVGILVSNTSLPLQFSTLPSRFVYPKYFIFFPDLSQV